jgi:hypothetical protein
LIYKALSYGPEWYEQRDTTHMFNDQRLEICREFCEIGIRHLRRHNCSESWFGSLEHSAVAATLGGANYSKKNGWVIGIVIVLET